MAAPYSEEELRAACEARGLAADGDTAALHDRLGAALVDDLLRSRRRPKRRHHPTSPMASHAAWLAFAARERPLVAQAGLTGRLAAQELGARWKRFKARDAPGAPLPLPAPAGEEAGPSSSSAASSADGDDEAVLDGMRAALAELDGAELAEALAAHGLPFDEADHAANVDLQI